MHCIFILWHRNNNYAAVWIDKNAYNLIRVSQYVRWCKLGANQCNTSKLCYETMHFVQLSIRSTSGVMNRVLSILISFRQIFDSHYFRGIFFFWCVQPAFDFVLSSACFRIYTICRLVYFISKIRLVYFDDFFS